MSKVTSKLQVTLPKALAKEYGIEPGTEISFEPAGEVIRVRLGHEGAPDTTHRLKLFDEAMARVAARIGAETQPRDGTPVDRGWTREELYGDRGVPR